MRRPAAGRVLGMLGAANIGYWGRSGFAYCLPDTPIGEAAASACAVLLGVGFALLAARFVFAPADVAPDAQSWSCEGESYLWAHRWVATVVDGCCGGFRCRECGWEVEAHKAPTMCDAIEAGLPGESCP